MQHHYYAMKQLQFNLNRTFGVKQGNRYLITKQVQSLLKDNYPKIVLRADIKGFYENVPQEYLLEIITSNQLLSPKSKQLIKKLFYSYNELTGQLGLDASERKGVPRGAGISAYLSELFIRKVDSEIQRMDGVLYYGRYVDDIIVIFLPNWKKVPQDYLNHVKEIIEKTNLTLNEAKTFVHDLTNSNTIIKIEFLGYVFELENNKYLRTLFSERKKGKYINRIRKTFETYKIQREFAQKDAYKMLIHRVNYLTKNTRLHKPKKGLIGIYYSNSLVEKDCSDLSYLDNEFYKIIDEEFSSAELLPINKKLKQFSFEKGFVNKEFFNINSKRKRIEDLRQVYLKEKKKLSNNFERVISIWK